MGGGGGGGGGEISNMPSKYIVYCWLSSMSNKPLCIEQELLQEDHQAQQI